MNKKVTFAGNSIHEDQLSATDLVKGPPGSKTTSRNIQLAPPNESSTIPKTFLDIDYLSNISVFIFECWGGFGQDDYS